MRRVAKLLPALAALFFMGACATSPDAAADARGWFLNTEAGETKLAYGTPQSDDAPLLMSCLPGSGRVTVSRDSARPGQGVTLASGDRRVTLHGSEQPDMLNGQGVIVTAQTETTNAVLQRFTQTGRLALVADRERADLPATPEEREQIRAFFDACGARR
jgi:hypothetical protein